MRFLAAFLFVCSIAATAQSGSAPPAQVPAPDARAAEIQELRAELARISARLDSLERGSAVAGAGAVAASAQPSAPPAAPVAAPAAGAVSQPSSTNATPTAVAAGATPVAPAAAAQQAPAETPSLLPAGATLNLLFDGYYEFNFNQPPGRVNDLRAYDVLSNTISINQADVVFELAPDLTRNRRYGMRLDLQFGQATDTLQGNPSNEPRPDVYRNIFQAYGTYIVPVGKGINIDFGKWASSLGIEGNYTKDQMNYTRSFYFYFLPFYHSGARMSYKVDDKFAVNYWVVNGANQSEPTNGFKDELFGFTAQPAKSVSWTSNYYLGQEHPDTVASTTCTIPVQPGLCVTPLANAPNGKLHIFDNYVTWQATKKLELAGEGDYVIERDYSTSSPDHVSGGATYAQYQATARSAFAVRGEYLSDRGGLFSARNQAIKEGTGTYKFQFADGFDAFLEFRRDWSNVPYFLTHNAGAPSQHQSTATLGLVWWYGGKQGSW